jgi:hypothetical protein
MEHILIYLFRSFKLVIKLSLTMRPTVIAVFPIGISLKDFIGEIVVQAHKHMQASKHSSYKSIYL